MRSVVEICWRRQANPSSRCIPVVGDPLVSLGDRIDALDVSRKGLGEHQGDNIFSDVEGVILPNLPPGESK